MELIWKPIRKGISYSLNRKYQKLLEYLRNLHSVAVAISGGVDSTFLLFASVEAVGENALAITGHSPVHPKREVAEAIELARQAGAKLKIIETDEMDNEAFSTNPASRCFVCKSILFESIWKVAGENGCSYVIEGSNLDDLNDFRPGMDALARLNVKSPLVDLGFKKEEIRRLSKEMGLSTWNKPAFACLASRIPYGNRITVQKLSRIEKAEYTLREMGFEQVRVRDYDKLCRIEVGPPEISRFTDESFRKDIVRELKAAGYSFICLDLEGYRTGSMNEAVSKDVKDKARAYKGQN